MYLYLRSLAIVAVVTDEEVNILRAVYDEAKELEANYKAQARSCCSHSCVFYVVASVH